MDKISIICYGDSNTFGHDPVNGGKYPEDRIWPYILEKKLPEGSMVTNCGMNGRTTAFDRDGSGAQNGLKGFESALAYVSPSDLVIFMLGTNDCSKDLRLTAGQIAGGMEKLVTKAEEYCSSAWGYVPRMMIVCPPAMREDISRSPFRFMIDQDSVKLSRELAGEYERTAENLGCMYLDATDLKGVSERDSMHLTEEGHRNLAKMVYEYLEEHYKKRPAKSRSVYANGGPSGT